MSSAYNPNKQGWGFAAVVCLITAGLFFTARTIHARTYRHPRDPMYEQVYRERDVEKHEAPASPGTQPSSTAAPVAGEAVEQPKKDSAGAVKKDSLGARKH